MKIIIFENSQIFNKIINNLFLIFIKEVKMDPIEPQEQSMDIFEDNEPTFDHKDS